MVLAQTMIIYFSDRIYMFMPVIECRNVWKIYEPKVPALRGVSLRIEAGEFCAIVGPSGCGKSTLLNLMGCLDVPTRGRVLIDGCDTRKLGDAELSRLRREKIGFVFQFFNLIPTLTALENVVLPTVFSGRKDPEKAKRLLEAVGLGSKVRRKPAELSGGERQRVAIARALVNDPEVVLADEPTGNLDSESGTAVLELLSSLNRDTGVTLVLITHDPEVAKRAERIIYMRDGKIVREVRR